MWDQWLESMVQKKEAAPEKTLDTDPGKAIQPVQHAWGGQLAEIFQLLEWWRWSLVAGGLSCLIIGLILLLESSQSPGAMLVAQSDSTSTLSALAASESAQEPVPTHISELLYVDVGGAVVHPGVYSLEKSARVGKAIEAAGGLSKQAHQTYIRQHFNGASLLQDGQKIYIPFEGESIDQKNPAPAGGNGEDIPRSDTVAGVISINSGSAKELDSLPGIGAVRAQQIIDGRPYARLEELTEKQILTASIFTGLNGLISL